MEMEVKKYADADGNPYLYAEDLTYMTLQSFYSENKAQWGIKHGFDHTTMNPLLQYLINQIEDKFPLNRLHQTPKMTLRISPRQWAFPKHFDGVENFMFLLNGNRHVELSYEDKGFDWSLSPGDILYIPSLWDHFFTANNEEPPIVVNIMFLAQQHSSDFENAYPRRMDEISKRI